MTVCAGLKETEEEGAEGYRVKKPLHIYILLLKSVLHVKSDGESLSGEEHFQQSLLEQDLNNFFQNR